MTFGVAAVRWHHHLVHVHGGYFDTQINGGWGHHFSNDPSSIWAVAERLLAHGVTQFLPTLISEGFERLDEALDVLAAGPPDGWVGATPVGWHLEGPWLAPSHVGAHAPAALRHPEVPDRLTRADGVALVTLAPELPGAHGAIAELVARGVAVSMGHSAATLDEVNVAVEAGACMGTHLFNAMSGLHHREPGLAAALLDTPELHVGLIADGQHVAPTMVRLAWRLAGERIVLVSDAVSLLGLSDQPAARRTDGTLMGATVALDQCVRNVVAFGAADLTSAAAAASSVPRAVLGIPVLPSTHVEIDEQGMVGQTVIDGAVVFER